MILFWIICALIVFGYAAEKLAEKDDNLLLPCFVLCALAWPLVLGSILHSIANRKSEIENGKEGEP